MPRDFITHPSQTFRSPDGTLGYLAIHRCASSSLAQWFKYDSGLSWTRGTGFDPISVPQPALIPTDGGRPIPQPDLIVPVQEVLVVVRDPIERWLSAMAQVAQWDRQAGEADDDAAVTRTVAKGSINTVYTNNDDAHFARQRAFWVPYVAYPLTFVDIGDINEWMVERGLPPVPGNINQSKPAVKQRLRSEILTPLRRDRLLTRYAVDVDKADYVPPSRRV